MLILQDVDPKIGGFEVIPDTATDEMQDYIASKYHPGSIGDWVLLGHKIANNQLFKGKNKLVKGKAGDLVLWDSRTIHGGIVGPGYESFEDSKMSIDKFARLAFTVCMAPKSMANSDVI